MQPIGASSLQSPSDKPLTREDVRAAFERRGESVTAWAQANGFRRLDVAKVLSGQWQGRRGKAHNIAVALGLKAGERNDLAEG